MHIICEFEIISVTAERMQVSDAADVCLNSCRLAAGLAEGKRC
jgi:hypothetical protein